MQTSLREGSGPLGSSFGTVPRLDAGEWSRHRHTLCRDAVAVVIAGATVSHELAAFSPERMVESVGDRAISAWMTLPTHGVPYASREMAIRDLSFADFVDEVQKGASGYLAQAPLSDFAPLAARLPVSVPCDERTHAVNLWVGAKTRSGLHFDGFDNMFVQLHGRKRVVIASSRKVRSMQPFPDNYIKSRIDLEDTESQLTAKALAQGTFSAITLEAGDVLYIPRGWWHYLATDEISVSVNHWFGRALGKSGQLRRFASAGWPVWRRTLRDFVVHGLLGKPYIQRPYSPAPTGVTLARAVGFRTTGRIAHRRAEAGPSAHRVKIGSSGQD